MAIFGWGRENPPRRPLNVREEIGEPTKPSIGKWTSPIVGEKEVAAVRTETRSVMATRLSDGEEVEHVVVEFTDGTRESIPSSELVLTPPEQESELLLSDEHLDRTASGKARPDEPEVSFRGEIVEEVPTPTDIQESIPTPHEAVSGKARPDEPDVRFAGESVEERDPGTVSPEGTAEEPESPEVQSSPVSKREYKERMRLSVRELESLRRTERDARAIAFAEKYNLTEERTKMLEVEERYRQAVSALYRKEIRIIPYEIDKEYQEARLAWRKVLDSTDVSDEDRISAKFIAVRDTSLRAEAVRDEEHERVLSLRDKGLFGTLKKWAGKTWSATKTGGSFYSGATQAIGTGLISAGEFVSRKKMDAERKARASRILGSAVLWSTLASTTGGAAAIPATIDLVTRVVRGTVGVTAGYFAASKAGKIYRKFVGAEEIEERKKNIGELYAGVFKNLDRDPNETSDESMEVEAKIFSKGKEASADVKQIQKEEGWVQMGTAAVVGGGAAITSGIPLDYLNSSLFGQGGAPARAAEELTRQQEAPQQTPPAQSEQPVARPAPTQLETGGEPPEQRTQPTASAQEPQTRTTTAPETRGPQSPETTQQTQPVQPASQPEYVPGAIDEAGEGSDRAFRELQQHLRSTLTEQQLAVASPALRHFLDSDPNAISREMGEAYGTRGIVTHPGDRFYLDSNQNLIYDPANGEPQTFIQNDANDPRGYRINAVNAEPLPNAESAATPNQPESSTPNSGVPETNRTSTPQAQSETTPPATGAQQPQTPHEAPGTRSVQTLEEFTAEPNSQRAGPAGGEVVPPATVPAETPAIPQGTTTLEDFTGESRNSGASERPLSWTPEAGLPQENALFRFSESPNVIYAHSTSPEQSLQLAREYGLQHPDTRIYFDNTKYDWLGGSTPQVGSLEFDRYGNLKSFTERTLNQNGTPMTEIDTTLLRERIA